MLIWYKSNHWWVLLGWTLWTVSRGVLCWSFSVWCFELLLWLRAAGTIYSVWVLILDAVLLFDFCPKLLCRLRCLSFIGWVLFFQLSNYDTPWSFLDPSIFWRRDLQDMATLQSSETWYFVYSGTEAAVEDVVPSQMRLQSVPALLRGWCMTWRHDGNKRPVSYLKEATTKTCAPGTAFLLSTEGAKRYEDFWLGPQPLAAPNRITLTMKSGQLLEATVLVPNLPIDDRENSYFSTIWFDACEDGQEAFES